MLEIVRYLQSGKTLADLKNEFIIEHRRGIEFPNLVALKYGIDAPMKEQICRECRGIVLDEAKNWEVVCLPFYKFWDYKNQNVELDYKTLRAQTKEDGTLCTLYYAYDQWNVSTMGSPDASGSVCTVVRKKHDFSFATLFWRVWHELGYKIPEDISRCYMFELCTEYNMILVKHKKEKLIHLGSRNVKTLQEYFPEDMASQYNWECVAYHPMKSVEDIAALTETFSVEEREGFVLVDGNFNRVKIKSTKYKSIADAIDGTIAERRLLEVIRKDETDELLYYCPYLKEQVDALQKRFNEMVQTSQEEYEAIKDVDNPKDFSDLAKKSKASFALFSVKNGRSADVRTFYRNCHINKILRLLGIK